ncbi:MAG: LysM peptidoglycan-binding domain-containing M23 family metallopeptidase [Chloroflexota bacterium]
MSDTPAPNWLDRLTASLNGRTGSLGLLIVVLLAALASRYIPRLQDVSLNLPTTEVEVLELAAEPLVEETIDEVSSVGTGGARPIVDTAIRRHAAPATYKPTLPTHDFAQHVVVENDTPDGVAEAYGIDSATLLWGNPELTGEAQLLQIGVTLTILPEDGVLHAVQDVETVESIAEIYGVEPESIIGYEDNQLHQYPHRPVPGTELFIPGGEKSLLVWSYTPNSRRGQVTAVSDNVQAAPAAAVWYPSFYWPANSWTITQYSWWGHRAIDVAGPIETAVYASESGTVVYAGWSNVGYGNLIVIDHGYGYQTYYAHLNSFWVANGQWVARGTPIAGMGTTGNSTGSHLHFEIRYYDFLHNPLDFLWQ